MSKVERKEYMESRTTRTMTPTRMKGSNPNISQFDNNLDNLLEDLQSTVSRPGSSLALQNGHVRESSRSYNVNSRSSSLNRATATEPIEYSTDDVYTYTSPDGAERNVKTTRKETYSYRTGGIQRGELPPERVKMQNNINQLDSLLDDLQQVKQNGALNNVGNQYGPDPGYHGFNQNRILSEKRIVERDISGYPQTIEIIERPVRDDPDAAITEFEEYRHRDYNKELSSTLSNRTVPALKTSSLTRNTKSSKIQQYPIEVVETTSHDINPEILANLDPELLPSGNTKVTTTIKTYTYEIPGSGSPADIIASPNNATVLSSAHSTPSKSFVYNSANSNYTSSSTGNVVSTRKPQQQQPPSPKMTNKFQQRDNRSVQHETITTRNYQPTNIVYEDSSNPNKRTYIYNETTLTRNPITTPIHQQHPAEKPYSPPHTPSSQPPREIRHHMATHESRSRSTDSRTTNVTNVHHHHDHGQQRSSSTGGRHSPYLNGIEPDYNVSDIIETFEAQAHGGGSNSAPSTPGGAGKPHPAGFIYPSPAPPSPVTPPITPKAQRKHALPVTAGAYPSPDPSIVKFYSSSNNTSGINDGGGNYKTTSYYYNRNAIDPQAYPRRFPVDENDNAPRDVNVLMKNIGAEPPTSPLNAGYIAHEQDMVQQRRVDQLKHQKEMEEQRKPDYYKDVQKSKNVTGPPVYYPPGHEMFARKEESGGRRAEGAMAKEAGKYKYEAESKSKSKSSSGMAIVPVCLPLCCGLPCTIL